MIKEITQYIASLGLGPPWVRDENLFPGHVPIRNKSGDMIPDGLPDKRYMAILENGGGEPISDMPDMVFKNVQILTHARTYFTARDDIMEMYLPLHGDIDTYGCVGLVLLPVAPSTTTYLAMVVEAMSVPAPIANPDEKGNFIFSCNFIWKIEKATCGA